LTERARTLGWRQAFAGILWTAGGKRRGFKNNGRQGKEIVRLFFFLPPLPFSFTFFSFFFFFRESLKNLSKIYKN